MGRYLLLTAVAALFLEFASIIWVGGRFGVLPTLGLMVLAAMAGMSLLRSAGGGLADTLRNPPRDMHFASREAASRFLMLLAGLLLIWPGFVSDVAALLLLLQPVRAMIANRLAAKVNIHTTHWETRPSGGPLVIEGEAVEIDAGGPEPRHKR